MKLWSPIGTVICKDSWASHFCYHLLEKYTGPTGGNFETAKPNR